MILQRGKDHAAEKHTGRAFPTSRVLSTGETPARRVFVFAPSDAHGLGQAIAESGNKDNDKHQVRLTRCGKEPSKK